MRDYLAAPMVAGGRNVLKIPTIPFSFALAPFRASQTVSGQDTKNVHLCSFSSSWRGGGVNLMFYFPPLGEYYRSQYGPVTYVFGFDQEPQTSQRGFTRTAGPGVDSQWPSPSCSPTQCLPLASLVE